MAAKKATARRKAGTRRKTRSRRTAKARPKARKVRKIAKSSSRRPTASKRRRKAPAKKRAKSTRKKSTRKRTRKTAKKAVRKVRRKTPAHKVTARKKAVRKKTVRKAVPKKKTKKKTIRKRTTKAKVPAKARKPKARKPKTTVAIEAAFELKPPAPRAPSKSRAKRRRKPPILDRERRRLELTERESAGLPAVADDRLLLSAKAGHDELQAELSRHTEASPKLTGGDVDARWQEAYAIGDEAPGGDNPTPGQDRVDEIGRSLGVTYQDAQELKGGDEITDRDRHRWEYDPASSDDWPHDKKKKEP